MATNYEKYASTPEKAASLVSQFRGIRAQEEAWESYQHWLANRKGEQQPPTKLMTEWLQEEYDD